MVDYKPELPPGVTLPPGYRIRTEDHRYRALEALARSEGWSQKAFSETLRIEADRVSAEHAKAAAPAATPAAPAAAPDFGKMSTREKLHFALQQSDARRAEKGNQPS